MSADVLLKIDTETNELRILGVSRRLQDAIEQYGTVVVHHTENDQPYEIYKEQGRLKAQAIQIQS